MTCDSVRRVIGRRAPSPPPRPSASTQSDPMSNPSASPPPRPSALYCAPFRLLRPFTLRCTGKRGAAESEGARQTEKSAADGSRVGGVTTCETPSRHARRPAGRGRRARSSSAAGPVAGTTGGAGVPEPARRAAPEGPAALIRVRRRRGAGAVVRMGLLGRLGAGSCPNLLQRRPGPGSAPRRSAEYQRFASGTSTGSGPLQQIWTTRAAAGPRDEDAARLTATTTSTPTTRRAPDDRTGSAGTSRPRSDDGDAILTVGRGSRERRPARKDAHPRPARAPWAARGRAPTREIVT